MEAGQRAYVPKDTYPSHHEGTGSALPHTPDMMLCLMVTQEQHSPQD